MIILVRIFLFLIVIGIMFYYRKKKKASIIKTIIIGIVSSLSILFLLIISVFIFEPKEDNNPYDPVYGFWTIENYVNDFNETTGEKYVLQIAENGSFSNSATTNSELTAEILIDQNDIRVKLKEYDDFYAKDEEYIDFKAKRNNDVIDLHGFIDNQGYIDVGNTNSSPLMKLLLQGGAVKFYGSVNNGSSTYNFTIIGDHLKDALLAIGMDNKTIKEIQDSK